MVVDGSVVMIENMVSRLESERGKRPTVQIIREAAHEVARPIFFGVLIILMVYVPVATFSGTEGILFRPMAITVATAVFGSLLLALVYVPAVAALVFRKGVKVRRNRVMEWLRPWYRRGLEKHLDRRVQIVGVALVVFALSLVLMSRMGTEFLPELDEGSILIEQVRMPSVTLAESVENANWLAGEIMRRVPEVETVVPKTGRSDLANDWMGVHQTDVWVVLKPRDQWREGMTKPGIQEQIRPLLETEPGLAYNFTQPIAMRVDELTSGVKSDLAVKVFGEDLETLGAVADDIAHVLPGLEGTGNFFVEQTEGQPYFNIEADREAVAAYGLNVADVQRTIEAGLGGQAVSEVFEGQRRFDIVVRYPEGVRSDPRRIMDAPVSLANGETIPLNRVAHITAEEGPREIARENGWRRVIVGINLADIDIGTYVNNLQEAIEAQVDVPAGVFLAYGGAFEDQQRATRHLLFVVPLALFIILGLLYLMFGAVRYALLVFLNLPLALSGGIFLLWIRGLYLSVSASIGFVALFGVAVLNGIVLIEHLNHLRREGRTVREAVLEGLGRPAPARADDGARGVARLHPDGVQRGAGLRGAAPARHRRHRRADHEHAPDAPRPPGRLPVDREGRPAPARPRPPRLRRRRRRGRPPHRITPRGPGMTRLALALLALVTALPMASAQPLTLPDALARVETEHPDLGRLQAALAVNRGQRLLGYGIDAPTVSYAREGIDGGGFAEQRVVFSQGVASPVATYYGLRRIDTEADALQLDLAARRSLLRMGVEKAFVDVMYAERLIALRTEALDLAQQFLEAARLREEMGESAGLETMRAEIALAEAEAALVEAERTRAQAPRDRRRRRQRSSADVEVTTPGPLAFHPVDVARGDVFGSVTALPELQSAQTSVAAAPTRRAGGEGGAVPRPRRRGVPAGLRRRVQ